MARLGNIRKEFDMFAVVGALCVVKKKVKDRPARN